MVSLVVSKHLAKRIERYGTESAEGVAESHVSSMMVDSSSVFNVTQNTRR